MSSLQTLALKVIGECLKDGIPLSHNDEVIIQSLSAIQTYDIRMKDNICWYTLALKVLAKKPENSVAISHGQFVDKTISLYRCIIQKRDRDNEDIAVMCLEFLMQLYLNLSNFPDIQSSLKVKIKANIVNRKMLAAVIHFNSLYVKLYIYMLTPHIININEFIKIMVDFKDYQRCDFVKTTAQFASVFAEITILSYTSKILSIRRFIRPTYVRYLTKSLAYIKENIGGNLGLAAENLMKKILL